MLERCNNASREALCEIDNVFHSYLKTNESTYYVAYTPGFSTFAIAAEGEKIKLDVDIKEKEIPENKTDTEIPSIVEIEGGEIKEGDEGFFVITGRTVINTFTENGTMLLVIILFGVGIGLYVYVKRKR